MAENVAVHYDESDEGRGAHWSSVERCGSVWCCPVCAAVIRAERAAEIQSAARVWQEQGGSLVFVTMTLRHRREDALADNLHAVLEGWRRTIRGAPWQRQRDRLGIAGYVRAVEATWGEDAGWHPHVHALLFVDERWSEDERSAFEAWLYDRWARFVTKLGARLPNRLRGVDVRTAGEDGSVLAQYLAKVQEKDGTRIAPDRIGQEVARTDLKAGHAGNLTPFDLLDAPDSVPWSQLWTEFYEASRGRRAIVWSKGLREALDLEDERTDEQIIEETDAAPVVLLVPGDRYDRIKNKPGDLAAVLEHAERGMTPEVVSTITGEVVSLGGSPPGG